MPDYEGMLLIGLFPMACSTCFLIQLPAQDGTAYSGLGYPTSIIYLENAPQTGLQTNLMAVIPQVKFPLSRYVWILLTKPNKNRQEANYSAFMETGKVLGEAFI